MIKQKQDIFKITLLIGTIPIVITGCLCGVEVTEENFRDYIRNSIRIYGSEEEKEFIELLLENMDNDYLYNLAVTYGTEFKYGDVDGNAHYINNTVVFNANFYNEFCVINLEHSWCQKKMGTLQHELLHMDQDRRDLLRVNYLLPIHHIKPYLLAYETNAFMIHILKDSEDKSEAYIKDRVKRKLEALGNGSYDKNIIPYLSDVIDSTYNHARYNREVRNITHEEGFTKKLIKELNVQWRMYGLPEPYDDEMIDWLLENYSGSEELNNEDFQRYLDAQGCNIYANEVLDKQAMDKLREISR